MTIPRRRTPRPVPLGPTHKRAWRSLWRRCSCGLPAPCVDRRVPPSISLVLQTAVPSHPRRIADPAPESVSHSIRPAAPAPRASPAPRPTHCDGLLLPAGPRPIAHPRNAPQHAQNHPPTQLGSITHPIRAHPGQGFDEPSAYPIWPAPANPGARAERSRGGPVGGLRRPLDQSPVIPAGPLNPIRPPSAEPFNLATHRTPAGPPGTNRADPLNTHRNLPVDAVGSARTRPADFADAPRAGSSDPPQRRPLPRQPPDGRIDMARPRDHGWWAARADPAGSNTGAAPTHWSRDSPAWTAPTMLFSQVGRAGALTPAQAYRADRGRSW
jgi:hypothetical protein